MLMYYPDGQLMLLKNDETISLFYNNGHPELVITLKKIKDKASSVVNLIRKKIELYNPAGQLVCYCEDPSYIKFIKYQSPNMDIPLDVYQD